MRPLALALAVGAALTGACGKGSVGDPGPPPSVVTFQLRNDGIATVYLLQDCLVEYTITSLADPVHVVERYGGCVVCECGQSSCPVCGACFQGSREVAIGAALEDHWTTEIVTSVPTATGSCQRRQTLPDGPYRIDVPVYGSDADALARTAARTAIQSFVLPVPGDIVTVALGVSP